MGEIDNSTLASCRRVQEEEEGGGVSGSEEEVNYEMGTAPLGNIRASKLDRKVGHLALKLNATDHNSSSSSSSSSQDEESDETSISSSAFSNLSKQKYLLDIGSSEEIMPNASRHLLSSLVIRDHHLMIGGKKKVEKTKKHTREKQSDKSGNGEEESSVNTSTNVGRSVQKRGFRKRRNR